jgi:type I restriction enzyme S subunit
MEVVHGMNLLNLRLDQRVAHPRYILHALRSNQFIAQISTIAKKSVNQASFNISTFKGLEIPLPQLEEQRRIAAILDASQCIRQLHFKRTIGLSALRQSLYRQLESQPGSRLLSLSSLAKITSGYAFKASDFCEQGVHVIRMSDLNGEYVELEGSAMVPPAAVEGLERFELFEGDILLGMSGSLGKLGIVPSFPAGSRAFLNQRVAKISLLPGSSISRELLIEAIKSKEYLSHLERCAAGVAVRNVSAAQMLDFVVPAPTQHEGHVFAEQCRLIGIQLRRSEQCMAQSAALQASLSTDFFGMQ